MQRQSLGSPSSKLEIHGGSRVVNKEEKRKSGFSPAADSTASTSAEDIKTEKPIRPNMKSERSIHLVPILILLCFTILYLFSHEPSTEDSNAGVWSHRALKEDGRTRHRRMGPP
ncbi:uncharacterized protein LOC110114581 [Dendrobium catenatum]|uniref:uncharacterized protein LOC110114581 n=1 Tax=Dendrobium catenatum TaxID=906689 RepID=UPI0009F365C1|nr:uncharacterized protein LOC110114581 [Dendrobium catenatum]